MNLDVLWDDGPVIVAHALAAMLAVAIGGVQLASPKGTVLHRSAGYVWVAAMALVALSSFFIHELRVIGLFSPIHLLSILTLYAIWRAVTLARAGRIAAHKKAMVLTYILALLLTGGFTFLPGRTMYEVLFGG